MDARLFNTQREHLFLFWEIQRFYSVAEIRSAELFRLLIGHTFEPSGEECGTQYDDSAACPSCGAAAPRVSRLFLDSRKLPRGKDIARTIGGEWIVSQRLAEVLGSFQVSGVEFRSVYHKALFEEDPLDLSKLDAGKKLLQLAGAAGLKQGSAEYYLWLNRPEQSKVLDEATREYVRRKEAGERPVAGPLSMWGELVVGSKRVPLAPPTRAGVSPFDSDPEKSGRCKYGDTIGLRLISEIFIERSQWNGSDVCLRSNSLEPGGDY